MVADLFNFALHLVWVPNEKYSIMNAAMLFAVGMCECIIRHPLAADGAIIGIRCGVAPRQE